MKNGIRIAIFKAALEAVQASMDAHGHIVEPRQGWDFISNLWFEEENSDYSLLPSQMPREFKTDYFRLAFEYSKSNPFVVGTV